jgi:vacuolar-type H+-ATPase subunit B/Vma2
MKEYKTISEVSGPLVYVDIDEPVAYDEMVEIETPDGEVKRGQVLESSDEFVAIQVFEGTEGIGQDASVRFLGETLKMPVTEDLLGRVLDGSGNPSTAARTSCPRNAATSSAKQSTPTRASTPRSSSRRASLPSTA